MDFDLSKPLIDPRDEAPFIDIKPVRGSYIKDDKGEYTRTPHGTKVPMQEEFEIAPWWIAVEVLARKTPNEEEVDQEESWKHRKLSKRILKNKENCTLSAQEISLILDRTNKLMPKPLYWEMRELLDPEKEDAKA